MRLEVLERLAVSMNAQQIHVQLFEHRHGCRKFDVFFFIGQPSELLLGARGAEPPLAIAVDVLQGGQFDPSLGDRHGPLCEFLGLHPNAHGAFLPTVFFERMELSVPLVAQHGRVPPPALIARYCQIEDPDKFYFAGWRSNDSRSAIVTHPNLEKTRRILGWKAYDLCKRANISSCWTDDPGCAVTADLAALQGPPIE